MSQKRVRELESAIQDAIIQMLGVFSALERPGPHDTVQATAKRLETYAFELRRKAINASLDRDPETPFP